MEKRSSRRGKSVSKGLEARYHSEERAQATGQGRETEALGGLLGEGGAGELRKARDTGPTDLITALKTTPSPP